MKPGWAGPLAVAAVGAWGVAEAVRIGVTRPTVVLYGDQALIDLDTRRAVLFDQLVGPYSRGGFHHPGPAVFYLLAPFLRLLEPSQSGLYLGAVVLNSVSLIAAIALLWRTLGARPALWAAVCIDLFVVALGVGTLREPWNPYLVIGPMILLLVLWALTVSGVTVSGRRRVSFVIWTAVVGSYEAQTHVATAPFVAVLLIVMVAVLALRLRRRPSPPEGDVGAVIGAVIGAAGLVALWFPSVVEAFRDHPDNLTLMWDYLTSSQPRAGVGPAAGLTASALSVLPFGNHDYASALHRSPAQLAVFAALSIAALTVALTVGRRQPFVVALAAAAGMEAVVGFVSMTRAPLPLYPYFALWLSTAPLMALMAAGLALASLARPLMVGLLAAAVAAGSVNLASDLRSGSIAATTGSGPWPGALADTSAGKRATVRDTALLAGSALRVLPPGTRWVDVDIATPAMWPYAAGLVLALDEKGIQSTVSPAAWDLYFGYERRPGRPVAGTFTVSGPLSAAGPPVLTFRIR